MKGIFKKAMSVVLVAAILLCSASFISFADFDILFNAKASDVLQNGYYYYEINEDGKAEICNVDVEISGDITVPTTLDGHVVAGIKSFSDCMNLTGVVIPEGIEYIGTQAFRNCKNLKTLSLPASLTEIGNGAFAFCDSLSDIIVSSDNPHFVTDEHGVLYNKDKTSLVMYPLAKEKGDYIIPSTVIDILGWAFENSPMYNNPDNWEDGVLYIDNHLIDADNNLISNYQRENGCVVKDGTVSIASHAFDSIAISKITIPDSVVNIGSGAFEWIWDDIEIVLPQNLKVIKERSFFHCSEMTSIEIPKSVTVIEDGAFGYCGALENIDIPSGVTDIGAGAFEQCCSAKGKIEIPYGVTEIRDVTFDHCNNIDAIIIPETVTKIGDVAFGYCTSLEEIKIPESVTEIGDYAFLACHNLKSLIIPDGVKCLGKYLIGDYSQKDDSMAIENVHIPASVTVIGENMFGDYGELGYICSDTADCYAKTYADVNGIEFKVCDGHGEIEDEEEPSSIFDVIVASITAAFDTVVNWFRNLFKSILKLFGNVGF